VSNDDFVVWVFPRARHHCVFHIIRAGRAIGARGWYCLFHIIKNETVWCGPTPHWLARHSALDARDAFNGMNESQLAFLAGVFQCDLQSPRWSEEA
jgi:hypothetical protein